ncbi:MAG: Bug family tripartite tricarboxylate transporter substrate binding protein [Rhodospirillaceae bacterium]
MTRTPIALLMAVTLACPAATVAAADKYPIRPIRLVVPFPPGAASDFFARTIGMKLGELYGQQVVVDNRPGAGGVVGSVIVASSAPDGYTLSLIGTPHVVNSLLTGKGQYRAVEDFTAITQVTSLPNVIVVSPTVQAQTLKDLIALAKAKPGQLNYGSAGIGSLSHMAGELFVQEAGIKAVHVPFKLLGDATSALLNGSVHYYVFPVAAATPLLEGGRLRALAVTTKKRLEGLPNVPTTAEAGLPGYTFEGWFGVAGPANLPRGIVSQLNADIIKVLQQSDTKEKFTRQGAEVVWSTPQEFQNLMKSEYARFQKVVREASLKVQ